jgi:hypothetical protein
MKRSGSPSRQVSPTGSLSRQLSPTGSPLRQLSPTGSPSRRFSPSPFIRSSGATSCSCARDWVPLRDNQHFACMFTEALWGHIHGMPLKDRLGDQRGGGEWELIKILFQRENSAYALNSQPRIPTQVWQGHVVTTDLPTLGTNPKRSRSESKTQEAKNLAALRSTRQTVRKHWADHPRCLGRLSAGLQRTARK